MEFKAGGKIYKIEFQRVKQSFHLPDPVVEGVKHVVLPNGPNKTIARLVEYEEDGVGKVKPTGVIYTAETVCKSPDRFKREEGRKRSLRSLTKKVPVSFKPFLWDAYLKRPKEDGWVNKEKLAVVLFTYGFNEADLKKIWARAQ